MSTSSSPKDRSEVLTLKFSPLSRLYFTLDREVELDKSLTTDEKRYERYLAMLRLSEQRRDNLIRNFLILDAVALLLLFGKSIQIPGINIGLSEIPAAREIAIFFSSLIFQFAATAFLNWNGYAAMIDTINLHRSRNTGIDPDYLSASEKFLEFAVKLYRPKMNIHGLDFIEPGRSYKAVSKAVVSLVSITMISLVFLHLIVTAVSVRQTALVGADGLLNSLLLYAYILFVFAANFGGLLLFFTITFPFRFSLRNTPPRT